MTTSHDYLNRSFSLTIYVIYLLFFVVLVRRYTWTFDLLHSTGHQSTGVSFGVSADNIYDSLSNWYRILPMLCILHSVMKSIKFEQITNDEKLKANLSHLFWRQQQQKKSMKLDWRLFFFSSSVCFTPLFYRCISFRHLCISFRPLFFLYNFNWIRTDATVIFLELQKMPETTN